MSQAAILASNTTFISSSNMNTSAPTASPDPCTFLYFQYIGTTRVPVYSGDCGVIPLWAWLGPLVGVSACVFLCCLGCVLSKYGFCDGKLAAEARDQNANTTPPTTNQLAMA